MISPLSDSDSLTPAELAETSHWIRSVQGLDGGIPWDLGQQLDPWDHVEAAMGLDVAGAHEAAAAAYRWSRARQRTDGSWAAGYRGDQVCADFVDVNFCAYIATGTWHHFLVTGDTEFLRCMWPTVVDAIDFTIAQQTGDGTVNWALDANGKAWPQPLLTSCCSIYLSLRSAMRIAEELGFACASWQRGAARLGIAIRQRPRAFLPKHRYAMDWYYPVLAGLLDAPAAVRRIERCWDVFVVEGAGVRCVSDRPWVTVAETCELVVALTALGWADEAARLFDWVRQQRCSDGSYWTGFTVPDGVPWPEERTTWTAGAVLLAAAALDGDDAVTGLFRLQDPAQDP
ncbi:MAG: prenyltransferase [Candidatus Dormibacteraeota bacterium]|nr:prenyltransferase [Candidatus Dormibacteraeota bacterium]